jgi:transaldolase
MLIKLAAEINHSSIHHTMKFFIDTASVEQIEEIQALGVLDGVTTNPSLMAKEGIKGNDAVREHYKRICDIVEGDVSAEVIATDYDGIIAEGKELASIDEKIVVKVPMIREGVKALKHFSSIGIRTNCTLVFSSTQGLLAAKAGANYISPFVGRLDDISTDGLLLISQLVHIFNQYGFESEVLAASIRHPVHIAKCAEIGADVVTCPHKTILQLFNHPLTDSGLQQFLSDYKKVQK